MSSEAGKREWHVRLLCRIDMMCGIMFSAEYTQRPIRHVHEPAVAMTKNKNKIGLI